MDKLRDFVNELEGKIPKAGMINETVSKSSVGWHIEHSLLAVNFIIEGLKNSNPEDYKWNFNFMRMLVFAMNKIPRGKGKAPETVIPKNTINADTLKKQIGIASEKIKELDTLMADNYIKHPVFGNMNLNQTMKFLVIHTKHHVDIINDIIKTEK
ncbi:MAG: DUF1569 domain-containing protein [Ignavibacteria bacterium]|nr:DUF1569 domain-containing protein [Ignavibacteria bacterium]